MAVTITLDSKAKGHFFSGAEQVRRGTIKLNTYATNGVAIAKTDLGLHSLDALRVYPAGGYVFAWDKTNGKVIAYRQTDPAAAGGADVPLVEVANGVDLSGTAARFEARGL